MIELQRKGRLEIIVLPLQISRTVKSGCNKISNNEIPIHRASRHKVRKTRPMKKAFFKLKNMNFHVVQSLVKPNTYFIFREIDERNCTEIKVVVQNNYLLPSHDLTPDEANYFRENVLEIGHKQIKK